MDLSAVPDTALVVAALVGSIEAFDELVRRYRRAVLLTAEAILGDRAAAEDAAQETLLLAFKALPQLEDPRRFAGWLHAIARHQAQRTLQSSRRCPTEADEALERLVRRSSQEIGRSDPQTLYERNCATMRLWRALDRLPPEYREPLLLRGLEEWPLSRIADYLGVSPATVRGRLYRAREALRRLLLTLPDVISSQGAKR